MAETHPSPSNNNPFAEQIGDVPATARTDSATSTETEQQEGVTQPAVLTREQEHWLEIEAKARLVACRTGSCGE